MRVEGNHSYFSHGRCHEKHGDGKAESLLSMGGRALGFGLSCLTKVIIWSCDGLLGNEQIACVILSLATSFLVCYASMP